MHYNVLIIGGGTAGIMTGAQIRRHDKHLKIAIMDPAIYHWYQPAWTLVAAGTFDFSKTRRNESDLIPKGVDHLQEAASSFEPENNLVKTMAGNSYSYDYLVICPGIKLDIDAMPGLREALETDAVCSNYIDPLKTKKIMSAFKGGTAVFAQPATPIKCGGAPQKAAYLADEYFIKKNVRQKTRLMLTMPGSVIFGVADFKKPLDDLIREKNIDFRPFLAPVKIDSTKQEIYFRYTGSDQQVLDKYVADGSSLSHEGLLTVHYDMLHLAPPQSAPDFIRNSIFAYPDGPNKGWMQVDYFTLRHPKYGNVFGLGDTVFLPTAKTGAAIRKQAPVVVANILSLIKTGKLSEKKYEGYSSCPLVTGYGKMLLAEFKYDNVRDSDKMLSAVFDTTKPLWSMWLLKKYALPWLYWNRMMKGKM